LPEGRSEDAFNLTEATWQLGVYGIHRLSSRFTAEAWLSRVWRTEDRLLREAVLASDVNHRVRLQPEADGTSDVNYEDRTWAGRLNVIYRARSGFRAELALDFVARDIIGTDRLPGAFDRDHSRLRFDFGWQFGERALLLLGSNLDLDGDGRSPNFDGGHGRFLLYW
jgi:hypothetical protein